MHTPTPPTPPTPHVVKDAQRVQRRKARLGKTGSDEMCAKLSNLMYRNTNASLVYYKNKIMVGTPRNVHLLDTTTHTSHKVFKGLYHECVPEFCNLSNTIKLVYRPSDTPLLVVIDMESGRIIVKESGKHLLGCNSVTIGTKHYVCVVVQHNQNNQNNHNNQNNQNNQNRVVLYQIDKHGVCRKVCTQLVNHMYCKVSSIEYKTVLGNASLVCKLSNVGPFQPWCTKCQENQRYRAALRAARGFSFEDSYAYASIHCYRHNKAKQWFSQTPPAYAWTSIVVDLTTLSSRH